MRLHELFAGRMCHKLQGAARHTSGKGTAQVDARVQGQMDNSLNPLPWQGLLLHANNQTPSPTW